jgi:hypothetical protein
MKRLFQSSLFVPVTIQSCFSHPLFLSLLCLGAYIGLTLPTHATERPALSPIHSQIPQTQTLPSLSVGSKVTSDPLESQYPIPWQAIQQAQDQVTQTRRPQSFRYQSAVSVSPDREVKAYSELTLNLHPDLRQSLIQSEIVIQTGTQTHRFSSTMHLGMEGLQSSADKVPGTFSILMPAAWSADGQSILIRQLEGVFGSDVASDYALVWQRKQPVLQSYSPTPLDYDSATLMGWSQERPGEILFQTRQLGDPKGQLVTVHANGTTLAAPSDRPFQVGIAVKKKG